MAEQKLFVGPRVRRIRNRLGLSQAEMAENLQISPSYMNLIERNQRPLTVQILLKLATTYQIDIGELEGGDVGETVGRLKEAFSDPLLVNELPSPAELLDIAESAPNASRGLLKLYEAYQELSARLSNLSGAIEERGAVASAASVSITQQVQAWFEENGPAFPDIEAAADRISERLTPRDDPFGAIKTRLREVYNADVRIVPHHVLPDDRARFDRHGLRVFLSEGLPHPERVYFSAVELALIGEGAFLDDLTEKTGLPQGEARRLARMTFAHSLAAAILMPRERFQRAASGERYDTRALARRFSVLEGRVMERLAVIKPAEDETGPDFACVITERAGSILKKIGGAGVALPHFGQLCARLPHFDALDKRPFTFRTVAFSDENRFVTRACLDILFESKGDAPPQTRLTSLYIRESGAASVFGEDAGFGHERFVGSTCRLCQRRSCAQRTMPPATRPAALHDYALGLSDFDPA